MSSSRTLKAPRSDGLAVRTCLVSLVFLSACTVGPDFAAPRPEVPAGWRNAADNGEAALQQEQLLSWWKKFSDPVLEKMVEEALIANFDVRAAVSRLREARASRKIAIAGILPVLDSSAEVRRSRSANIGRGTVSPSSTGGATSTSGGATNLYQAGFDAAWEIDIFGGRRREIESSEALVSSAEASGNDVLMSVASETASSYFRLRGIQRQLEITERNLALQRENVELAKQRFEGGFAGALDVTTAEADEASTSARLVLLHASVKQELYGLELLLAKHPEALGEVLAVNRPLGDLPLTVPTGLPSQLLERRSDILRAQAGLHAATAQVGVATAELFPRFSLTGTTSWVARSFGDLGSGGNAWAIGSGLRWPIFDGGRIVANIEVADARTEQALIEYERVVLNAFREVETSLVQYAREEERRKFLERAAGSQQEALMLARELYTAGMTDFLNVLTSERSLLVAENTLAESETNLRLYLVSLYKALGGGWEDNPVQSITSTR